MKKLLFITIFSLIFFATSRAHADCNIRPVAITNLNDLYSYTHANLSRPRLKIDNGKPKVVKGSEAQPYGLGAVEKKYYLGGYTQGDKITIYSKIFKLHKKCDERVKSKLRGMLAHEYTHYLDSFGALSNLIHSSNDEETAIISEHVLSKLIWGNVSVQYTRTLTSNEQSRAAILRNFFIENKQ